jgi:hypothetical protein
MAAMSTSLGEGFARGLAAKDHDQLRRLLHPELDFRAMTPGRIWEAATPGDVIDVLNVWFDDGDVIDGLELLETDAFSDRERVGYRLRVHNGDGQHLVEQQAYLSDRDGQIGWLRIMCSGYRPAD